MRRTEFEAVHITDHVLTSTGCSRDYYPSRDFISSHAPGVGNVSAVHGTFNKLVVSLISPSSKQQSGTTQADYTRMTEGGLKGLRHCNYYKITFKLLLLPVT